VPLTGKPTPALSFVQAYVSPPPVFELKVTAGTTAPEHTVTSAIAFTIGVGLMVIVKVFVFNPELVQPDAVAVTVIVPVIAAPVLFAGAV
jgi:hypothetical protein